MGTNCATGVSRLSARTCAASLTVLDTIVNLETRQLTYEAVLAPFGPPARPARHLRAGGGMEGAIAALRDAKAEGRVALVVSR